MNRKCKSYVCINLKYNFHCKKAGIAKSEDDVGTIFLRFGKATRSWGRITSNEFAKYAPIFWKRY